MKFWIRIIFPVKREHCRCLKHISILTILRTPVVQGGTIGGLKESGSVMRTRIAVESEGAIIISREMTRVTILPIVTDVVVTPILPASVRLLGIWCRCINNPSRARNLKDTSTKLTSLDR
jgi:hypothetical protein